MDKLVAYHGLILHWQARLNLISAPSVENIWHRHFFDSAQLSAHLVKYPTESAEHLIVDIGSGAGFPGLILAIMGHGPLHLVEVNQRKAVFLQQAARQLDLKVTVHAHRIEEIIPKLGRRAHCVTARAVAPLDRLLDHAAPLLAPGGVCLMPKGRNWDEEVRRAEDRWSFDLMALDSQTDRDGKILRIAELSPRSRSKK